jgi:hypothetical protein
MDGIEIITFDTLIDQEVEFLKYCLRNTGIKLIFSHIGRLGMRELTLDDFIRLRKSNSFYGFNFLLWNTTIPAPLCWELYTSYYDLNWRPMDKYDDTGWVKFRTRKAFLEMFSLFQKQSIQEKFFIFGEIEAGFSPVIEFYTPPTGKRYTGIKAQFGSWLNKVWLVWDSENRKWIHEIRDLKTLYGEYQQPMEFIEWQQDLFDWILRNWADKIIPNHTYHIKSDNVASMTAQFLANLMEKPVAGQKPKSGLRSKKE